jgi:hypothetical protein
MIDEKPNVLPVNSVTYLTACGNDIPFALTTTSNISMFSEQSV